jgi:hypothetical protein
MRFRVEPGFAHRKEEPRFCVRTLDDEDDGWKCGYRWQIQLLNDVGQGAATIEFGPSDDEDFILFLAVDVPQKVVEAAKEGYNCDVDGEGRRRLPLFLGGGLA